MSLPQHTAKTIFDINWLAILHQHFAAPQMKYQHMAAQNGGAAAPQEATDQATGASVSQDCTQEAEKGLFGSANSHSLGNAAKEVPSAVGNAAATLTGAPAFFASAVRETARRDPEHEPACMPPGEAEHGSASKDSRPGLSSACTLNSGLVAQVPASRHHRTPLLASPAQAQYCRTLPSFHFWECVTRFSLTQRPVSMWTSLFQDGTKDT